MSEEKSLETLNVWQKAMTFTKSVYAEVIPMLPADEKWALNTQLRRSSQSIPANIADGYGRYYYQETIRFCYIARGSLEEAFTQIKLANEPGFLPDETCNNLLDEVSELRRMLIGYIAFFKKSKRGQDEPGANLIRDLPVPYQTDFSHEDQHA